MMAEEAEHRRRLSELYQERFGEHVPLIRRQEVKGFIHRKPVWLTANLGLESIRKRAESMELEAARFYQRAAERRRTRRSANCLASWPRSSASTSIGPANWRRNISPTMPAGKKMPPVGALLCCRSCSRGWRD